MKPKKTVKPKPKKRPTGILREVKKTIDAGESKIEGNISIANINNIYKVKNAKDLVHEGDDFRIAYDFFLKLVILKKQ